MATPSSLINTYECLAPRVPPNGSVSRTRYGMAPWPRSARCPCCAARNLAEGVSELKIDFGPGYRAYYTQRGDRLVLLLIGGEKSTQQKDIRRAIELAREFQE